MLQGSGILSWRQAFPHDVESWLWWTHFVRLDHTPQPRPQLPVSLPWEELGVNWDKNYEITSRWMCVARKWCSTWVLKRAKPKKKKQKNCFSQSFLNVGKNLKTLIQKMGHEGLKKYSIFGRFLPFLWFWPVFVVFLGGFHTFFGQETSWGVTTTQILFLDVFIFCLFWPFLVIFWAIFAFLGIFAFLSGFKRTSELYNN